MFSVPPRSVRGSNERVVIEIIAALQMSFFVTVPAIVCSSVKILERRCEQVRAMNIARLLHHDLVMNTISL